MGRGARGALALATTALALTLAACIGGAGAPPTATPPPATAAPPTVPRPALDTPVAQASTDPANTAVHVVQPGETLGQIALRYYGDANRWQIIYDANRGQLPSPNALVVNMRLVIPPLSAAASPTPTTAPRAGASPTPTTAPR